MRLSWLGHCSYVAVSLLGVAWPIIIIRAGVGTLALSAAYPLTTYLGN